MQREIQFLVIREQNIHYVFCSCLWRRKPCKALIYFINQDYFMNGPSYLGIYSFLLLIVDVDTKQLLGLKYIIILMPAFYGGA